MDKKAFKQRMQELKSYRELNPGKGYLDFKSYKDGGKVDAVTGESRKLPSRNLKSTFSILDKNKVYNRIPAREFGFIPDDAGESYKIPELLSGPANAVKLYFNNDDSTALRYVDKARSVIKNHPLTEAKEDAMAYLAHEDAKDFYLNMPLRTGLVEESKYLPGVSNSKDQKYYKFKHQNSDYWKNVILDLLYNKLDTNQNKKQYTDLVLNNFTAGLGVDKQRGQYASIYDVWDYNTNIKGTPGDNVGSIIGGEPFEIYDRQYLDDIYGVNSSPDKGDYYGGYFPEIQVVGNKKSKETIGIQYGNAYAYADGGEIRSESKAKPPYPGVYKGIRHNPYTGLPLDMGLAKPFLDLEDAANFTPLGDAITVKDMGLAISNKDWKGLGWASLGLIPFVPSVTKGVRKTASPFKNTVQIKGSAERLASLSKVDRKAVMDMMDRIADAKKKEALRFADDFYLKNEADAVNARNLLVELLSKDKKYYKRAKETDTLFGTRYESTYDELLKLYNNNPDNLPKVQMLQLGEFKEGKVGLDLTDERAFDVAMGDNPLPSDFTIGINPKGLSDRSVLDHEMSHATDMVQEANSINKSPIGAEYWDNKLLNGSRNNSTFKDYADYIKDNADSPLSKDRYDYLTRGTEEKAFINTMRTDMAHRGIIKKRTQDPTKKQLKEYLGLPDIDPSIVKLSKLYKDTVNGMYKATRQMPYLAASGLTAYGAMKAQKEVYNENNKL